MILVPRRADGGVRDRLWEFCRRVWETEHPDLTIYEGYHTAEEGPFNRSAALNRAARAAGDWDVAVIIDSDVLVHHTQIRNALIVASRFNRLVFPFRVYHSLSQLGTSRVINGWTGDWTKESVKAYWDSVSACLMCPRKLWDTVGGFDERFVGWGWEDTAYACATDAVSGRLRLEGELWHLWHPQSPERNTKTPLYIASHHLARQYRDACHVGWEPMLAVLTQPGGPLDKDDGLLAIPDKLPCIPDVDGDCPTCGHPTLITNVRTALGGLAIPSLPEGVVACTLEGCPAMYQPIEVL